MEKHENVSGYSLNFLYTFLYFTKFSKISVVCMNRKTALSSK